MAAQWNDTSIPYGSRVLTINSVTYIADDIKVTRPTKMIERTNELDEPAGSVGVAGFVTGSATLQLASTSTAIPTNGLTFTVTLGASAETFYISEVGQSEDKSSEKKVSINFVKKYN